MKQTIRLNESELRSLIKETVKRIGRGELYEDYDQFSDTDFGGADPYSPNDKVDTSYGSLDGRWSFNTYYVDIEDYGDSVSFRIEDRETGKEYNIEGDEAQEMKERVMERVEEVGDINEAIRQEVNNYLKRNSTLAESKLRSLIKEVVKEVAMMGKSGEVHSLHGNDPKAWAIMRDLRSASYPFGNSKNERNMAYDDENYNELLGDDTEYREQMETEINDAFSDLV